MQYLKDDVKNNIMVAALGEFSRLGYLNASMRQIATAAGVTPGNIYRYFKNKEDLLHELLHPVHEQFLVYLQEIKTNVEQSMKQYTDSDDTSILYCSILEDMIMKLVQPSNTQFRIMLNQSEGSKYEHVKKDLILMVEDILQRVFLLLRQEEQLDLQLTHWIQMTASTLTEGLCIILRDYEDGPTVSRLITELLDIYTLGISQKMNLLPPAL